VYILKRFIDEGFVKLSNFWKQIQIITHNKCFRITITTLLRLPQIYKSSNQPRLNSRDRLRSRCQFLTMFDITWKIIFKIKAFSYILLNKWLFKSNPGDGKHRKDIHLRCNWITKTGPTRVDPWRLQRMIFKYLL